MMRFYPARPHAADPIRETITPTDRKVTPSARGKPVWTGRGGLATSSMSEEFERLDRLLRQLEQILEIPGEDGAVSPELSWQKLDLMYESMGPDALAALLRRQGMDRSTAQEALSVLSRRRRLMQ